MAVKSILDYTLSGVGGGAYAANDAVGVGLITLSGAASPNRPWGVIDSVRLIEAGSAQAAACNIYFFSRAITAPTNNAAFAPGKADLLNCLGVVDFAASDWKTTSGTNGAVASKVGVGMSYELSNMPWTGALYAVWVTTGTPTYPDPTGLKIVVGVIPRTRGEA